jgi:TonB family protein
MRFTPDLSVTSTQDAAAGYAAADTGVLVFSQGDVDVAPQKRISPAPEYPFIAQKLEIRGEALAKFVIGVRGTVERIVSIDAPHPSIEREVRKTLQQWKFNPAQKDGVPVRCYATQTFSFQQ